MVRNTITFLYALARAYTQIIYLYCISILKRVSYDRYSILLRLHAPSKGVLTRVNRCRENQNSTILFLFTILRSKRHNT